MMMMMMMINMMMMASAEIVETSVNIITNSPSEDYTHPDDHTLPTYGVQTIYSEDFLKRKNQIFATLKRSPFP